jgi:hypothetical protein
MTKINTSPPLIWSVVLLFFAGWLVLSVFTATQWQLLNATYGLHKPWLEYFRPALIANLLWAGVVPIVVYLANRIRLNMHRAYIFFSLHLLIGTLIAITHTVAYVLCLGLLLGGDENLGLGSHLLARKLIGSFQANLLIYAVIVAFVVGRSALTSVRLRDVEKAELEARLGNQLQSPIAKLTARVRGRTVLIPVADIEWISAAGDYVELHVGTDSFLIDDTITNLAKTLRQNNFVQIHRCTLVSTCRVSAWQSCGHGDARVIMKTGHNLRVSRKFAGDLRSRLGALPNI